MARRDRDNYSTYKRKKNQDKQKYDQEKRIKNTSHRKEKVVIRVTTLQEAIDIQELADG